MKTILRTNAKPMSVSNSTEFPNKQYVERSIKYTPGAAGRQVFFIFSVSTKFQTRSFGSNLRIKNSRTEKDVYDI